MAVPDLGRNLLSVKQVARNGVVSILENDNPRLEAKTFECSLQQLGHNLYYTSLDLTDSGNEPVLAKQAAANTSLRHWRLSLLRVEDLELLETIVNTWVSFHGPIPDCDVHGVGKSHQLDPPKSADH